MIDDDDAIATSGPAAGNAPLADEVPDFLKPYLSKPTQAAEVAIEATSEAEAAEQIEEPADLKRERLEDRDEAVEIVEDFTEGRLFAAVDAGDDPEPTKHLDGQPVLATTVVETPEPEPTPEPVVVSEMPLEAPGEAQEAVVEATAPQPPPIKETPPKPDKTTIKETPQPGKKTIKEGRAKPSTGIWLIKNGQSFRDSSFDLPIPCGAARARMARDVIRDHLRGSP